MRNDNDRDYSARYDFPEFDRIDDGRFRCLAMTLDDGRYIVMTDMGGMDYPEFHDFMVCVYRNEDSFPSVEDADLLGSFTSDDFADIDHALGAAEGCISVQS